VAERLKAAVC